MLITLQSARLAQICFPSARHIQRISKWTTPCRHPMGTSYSTCLEMSLSSSSANLRLFLASLSEWPMPPSTEVPPKDYTGILCSRLSLAGHTQSSRSLVDACSLRLWNLIPCLLPAPALVRHLIISPVYYSNRHFSLVSLELLLGPVWVLLLLLLPALCSCRYYYYYFCP